MSRTSWLSAIAVFTMLLVGQANEALGQSFITVTKCDTTTVNGRALFRITFAVHNSNASIVISEVTGHPIVYQTPGDTCRAIQVVGPPGWDPVPLADRGPGWATSVNFLYPGQTLDGFSFVLSRGTCCYEMAMSDQFFQLAGLENLCMTCPMATPARTSTWGNVKVLYR